MNQTPKRSDEPVFWGLFGAGGMWSAIISPAVILIIGIILPFSLGSNVVTGLMSDTVLSILTFCQSFLGRMILLFTIILPLWCGMHRLHHTLHDLKIHVPAPKLVFYGIASIVTLLAIYGIFQLGS